MPENQIPRPGILTVTAFHTDALDIYKFFIPYSDTLCDAISHVVDALNELANLCCEPRKLTTTNTKFSSVESVNEALAFWKENQPEYMYLDVDISRLVEEHADVWNLYHNLEEEIKFQLKRSAAPDANSYSISQATFDDVIDVFQEFFVQPG
jgi:hypothetical protein